MKTTALMSAAACAALALVTGIANGANEAFYARRAEKRQWICYRSFRKQLEMTGTFAGLGIPTRCFFAANTLNSGGKPYCEYPPIWQDGQCDWKPFDDQVNDLVRASPDARFLCMIDLNTPPWLTRRFALDSFADISHAAADPKWRAITRDWMLRFIDYAEKRHGDRIVAYILSGGGTSEWYEYDRGRSSRTKNAAWREWCARRGTDHGKAVPGEEVLWTASFEDFVYDPSTEGSKIDYWRFHCELIADALLGFAKDARAAIPKSKEIGAFFGYAQLKDTMTSFGHLDYERVYASPDIDFFIAPGNYSDRVMGGASGSQLVRGTALINGKRFLHEIDFGPHNQKRWTRGTWKTLADDIAGNTREAAFAIANQANCWYFDMWGGFYDQPEVRERIRKLKAIQDRLAGDASPSVAQTLFVVDPESLYGVNTRSPFVQGCGEQMRNRLAKTGAAYDVFSFRDLDRLDLSQYRLVCLTSAFLVTPERARFLRERVCRDGRTVLWAFAPGLSDGRTLDRRRVRTWAGVEYGTPGVTRTDMGGWTAVYAKDWTLYTPEELARIMDAAGAHRYVRGPAVVFSNASFLSVHVKDGGEFTVSLPTMAKRVTNLLTDETVAENATSFRATFASPDTQLFRIEGPKD